MPSIGGLCVSFVWLAQGAYAASGKLRKAGYRGPAPKVRLGVLGLGAIKACMVWVRLCPKGRALL